MIRDTNWAEHKNKIEAADQRKDLLNIENQNCRRWRKETLWLYWRSLPPRQRHEKFIKFFATVEKVFLGHAIAFLIESKTIAKCYKTIFASFQVHPEPTENFERENSSGNRADKLSKYSLPLIIDSFPFVAVHSCVELHVMIRRELLHIFLLLLLI